MLFRETVEPGLYKLIQKLCAFQDLQDFVLVGGTALSLQIGHRKSIDIDLFTNTSFEQQALKDILQQEFNLTVQNSVKNGIFGNIGSVKVDVLSHQYEWIRPFEIKEGIRMASREDIAAMKLNAIVGNGSRLKDFVDIAFLSGNLTLKSMLECFDAKYPQTNSMIALKSLGWFDDINFEVEIQYIGQPYNWSQIKERIEKMIQSPGHTFDRL